MSMKGLPPKAARPKRAKPLPKGLRAPVTAHGLLQQPMSYDRGRLENALRVQLREMVDEIAAASGNPTRLSEAFRDTITVKYARAISKEIARQMKI